jgi:class 3 adenylate cyclase/pimeloyl-ACP methyl ester carboxylesterase
VTEPRIQYATTSDGVSIAYGEAGEGRAVIVMPPPGFGHAEMAWRMFANLMPPLASEFHTIWYDARGTGLSDRDAIDFSAEAMNRDLEAVVERTRLDSFALVAWTHGVPIAVTYATAHPEQLSHLVLCDGFARFSDWGDTSAYRASVALLEMDWLLFTETFGQVVWAYTDGVFGRAFAALMRASTEPEAHRALWKATAGYDVNDLLPQLTTPTLVVHSRNNRLFPLAVGRRIAAAIPGARLTLIDDDVTYAPVPDLVKSFVSPGQVPASSGPVLPSGTAVIVFADIVDSTALTERFGDTAFRAKARDLDAALRAAIRDHSGTPIEGKLLGDGVLAVFTSARQAIEAALACGTAGDDAGLPLHLGLHAGDVIRERDPDGRNNIYGGAVNIASRIAGLSAAGEVLVSETVRSLARTSAGVRFEDRGEQALKGVGEPVRVWAVVEGE